MESGYAGLSNAMRGGLAVECFMIISGFVIFLLIDHRREPFLLFIQRRFLRIYPIYILLFFVAIPCSLVSQANVLHEGNFLDPANYYGAGFSSFVTCIDRLWANIWLHIPLHLTMLQGLAPIAVLPNSSTAFLGTAWSLSLEWQFYLIAIPWFAFASSSSLPRQLLVNGLCLFVICFSKRLFPPVEEGAALFFRLEFFYLGAMSYFMFNYLARKADRSTGLFAIAVVCAAIVFKLADKSPAFVPLCIWIVILGLLLEPSGSPLRVAVDPIFTNPVTLWLGKISYSIYLSHPLIMACTKWLCLWLFPGTSHVVHAVLVIAGTLVGTLALSAILHRYVEVPFIEMGKRIKSRPIPSV
ncbi:acyltransferase [soil metagenome]